MEMITDRSRALACRLTGGYRLYHIVNAAGEQISTVEDNRDYELYSCSRDEEEQMLKTLKIKKI